MSLLTIAPEIRMMLYRDFLGNRSMSIAILRQTCHRIRREIDNAMRPLRYTDGSVPVFDYTVDGQKLDGCTLETIESCLPSVETRNVDVDTWDFLFANAVDCTNWHDIDRLLDIYVYPLSRVLTCNHAERMLTLTSGSSKRPVKITRPILDSFVALVASCNSETIQKYYGRLSCKCIKANFVYSAIKQSLSTVLDALSLDVIDKKDVARLARAVGESGSVEMFALVSNQLYFDAHSNFLVDCFSHAACCGNHNLLNQILVLFRNIKEYPLFGTSWTPYSNATIEFIMDHITPADCWSPSRMVEAARFGSAYAFERLIALQPNQSSTEWRSYFATFARQVPLSLHNALMRSANDLTYFCRLYAEILPTALSEPVKPSFGGGPGVTMWSAIVKQSKSHLSASQMVVLLEHMLTFLNADARELLVDSLHHVLGADIFRLELAEAVMSKLSPCLECNPLTEIEYKLFAAFAADDDAYDWVCDTFNVTITPEEATTIIFDDTYMRQNVWRRWLEIGAQAQYGIYPLVDLMTLLYNTDDYHPPETVAHDHLQRLCSRLIGIGAVKPFRRIYEAASSGKEWAKVMLKVLETECRRSRLCRIHDTGCIVPLDDMYQIYGSSHPLTSMGYMRLYYQACEWFNITPLDSNNIVARNDTLDVAIARRAFGQAAAPYNAVPTASYGFGRAPGSQQ